MARFFGFMVAVIVSFVVGIIAGIILLIAFHHLWVSILCFLIIWCGGSYLLDTIFQKQTESEVDESA
jgi:hypothetical protein